MSAATWEPGEPIHSLGGVWVRPMFELIEDRTDGVMPDAASWPTPRPWDDLDGERL